MTEAALLDMDMETFDSFHASCIRRQAQIVVSQGQAARAAQMDGKNFDAWQKGWLKVGESQKAGPRNDTDEFLKDFGITL